MVSSPDYNPNTLNGSEIGSSFEDYLREDSPFFNRAISGSYPPASTIKPFVGLLGLEEGVITEDTKIEDKGFFIGLPTKPLGKNKVRKLAKIFEQSI